MMFLDDPSFPCNPIPARRWCQASGSLGTGWSCTHLREACSKWPKSSEVSKQSSVVSSGPQNTSYWSTALTCPGSSGRVISPCALQLCLPVHELDASSLCTGSPSRLERAFVVVNLKCPHHSWCIWYHGLLCAKKHDFGGLWVRYHYKTSKDFCLHQVDEHSPSWQSGVFPLVMIMNKNIQDCFCTV